MACAVSALVSGKGFSPHENQQCHQGITHFLRREYVPLSDSWMVLLIYLLLSFGAGRVFRFPFNDMTWPKFIETFGLTFRS